MTAEDSTPTPRADSTHSKPSDAWVKGSRWLLGLSVVFVASVLLGSLLPSSPRSAGATIDFAKALPASLAVAIAIERCWEALFGWYESFALATARLLGAGGKDLRWLRDEVNAAEDSLAIILREFREETPAQQEFSGLVSRLRDAEARLDEARGRIVDALKTPEYVALKRAITTLGSLGLGVAIGVTGRLTLFRSAGFGQFPLALDFVVTGLVVGSGPGPLHAIIGLLQQSQDAVAGLANLAHGSAINRVLAVGTESVPQAPVMLRSSVVTATGMLSAESGAGSPAPHASVANGAARPDRSLQRQARQLLRNR